MELLKYLNEYIRRSKAKTILSVDDIYTKELVIELNGVKDIKNVINDMIVAGVHVSDRMEAELNSYYKYNKGDNICLVIDYSDFVDNNKLYYAEKNYYIEKGRKLYNYGDIKICK